VKCKTESCENHTHQGQFVGEYCAPCFMSPIDMTKKYKTRSGLAARILCIDRKDYYSVVALIEITPGVEDIII